MEGIVGFAKLFREEVSGLTEGSIIVFTGSSAVCAPFAELLAYSIRDKGLQLYFSPMANEMDCRALKWKEGTGFGISTTGEGIKGAAAVIVLGGLAMPKIWMPDGERSEIHRQDIPVRGHEGHRGVLHGHPEEIWVGRIIKFDALINATMETEKQI